MQDTHLPTSASTETRNLPHLEAKDMPKTEMSRDVSRSDPAKQYRDISGARIEYTWAVDGQTCTTGIKDPPISNVIGSLSTLEWDGGVQ